MEWFSVTESAAEASEGINSHQPLEVLQRKRGSERLDNLPTDTKRVRGKAESQVRGSDSRAHGPLTALGNLGT